jgi:flagellar basal body-associated protein FliL
MFEKEITIINIILVLFVIGMVIYVYFFFANLKKQINELSIAIDRKRLS